ncbi:MAG: hypothetical protein Ct9H90mP9_0150 [Pseudomonadota bacterium]|nr:MAG: hypothetical protein Ct9H90mP9_0150 [Pseudomonadota bacterium]
MGDLQNQNGVSSDYIIIHPGSGNSAPNLNLGKVSNLAETILQETVADLADRITRRSRNQSDLVDKISGNRVMTSLKINLVQLKECIRKHVF